MSKQYDYKALIDAYITLQRYSSMPRMKEYYAELVSNLETLMHIKIEPSANSKQGLIWLSQFKTSIKAIMELNVGGGAGFLEGSPDTVLNSIAKNEPEKRDIVQQLINMRGNILSHEIELDRLYKNFLYDLLRLWNDNLEKTVTSEDLLAVGFDDDFDKMPHSWDDDLY
jgi:hypothetical protein